MPKIVYPVYLTEEQREVLTKQIKTGKHSAYEQTVAHVLLQVDRSDGREPEADEKVAEMFSISRRTVIRIKKRFVEESMQGALSAKYPKERPERRIIQGREEAELIVLACGASPDGSNRWTIRLLTEKMIELEHVDTVSRETIRRVLKKTNLNLG
jgi:transposase